MRLVQTRLPDDLSDWVNENFSRGFKQAFVEQCFLNLRRLLEDGHLPPESEYARQATVGAVARVAVEDVQSLKASNETETETEETE